MKASKRQKLEAAGWKVGTTSDFLGLTQEEAALLEMKLSLAKSLTERRKKVKLTQTQLAAMIGSSQSRVAKMEVADHSVSFDLFFRSLLSLGATSKEIGKIIASIPVTHMVGHE